MSPVSDAARAAGTATERILHDTLHGTHRGVVVDSPPGAGKSTLVVRAARELVAAGETLMVVAQTNAQVDDLVDRLATAEPGLPIGRLHGSDSPRTRCSTATRPCSSRARRPTSPGPRW